jgi:hypothetical protein
VTLRSEAQGYSDFNDKGTNGDTLIALFPSIKSKPMIVIRQGRQITPILNEQSRYSSLSYTYYEAGDQFASFVTGDVYRANK